MCQALSSLNIGKELEADRVSHRHIQAVAGQADLRKAEEAASCATSCCLWDSHFGSVTFCPQVAPHCSRRKGSCSLSVLTEPNLAPAIVTEQLPDTHKSEGNNRDVVALSPCHALWSDFMAGEQEWPLRKCCSSHTMACGLKYLCSSPLAVQLG